MAEKPQNEGVREKCIPAANGSALKDDAVLLVACFFKAPVPGPSTSPMKWGITCIRCR